MVRSIFLVLALVLAGCASGIKRLDGVFQAKPSRWVFVDVQLVDVIRGEIDSSRDVYIEAGVIKKIEKHTPTQDSGYAPINAGGRFLSPGLTDSHVHIYSKTDLLLYVANGVTGVQNMWGFEGAMVMLGLPNSLELKQHVSDGGFGPRIWTAGPLIEGAKKTHPLMTRYTDAASAEAEVSRQQQLHYDFIKTYDWLSADVFAAIILKSKALGIPVKGHVPYAVGLQKAIELGMAEVEHMTGWIDIDAAKLNVAEDGLDTISILVRDKAISVCPSLLVFQRVTSSKRADKEFANHAYRKYLSFMDKWMESMGASSMRDNVTIDLETYPEAIKKAQETVLRNLVKHGVNVVACTDAGNPYIYPGVSLHEEMAMIQSAGVPPWKILQMATVNAAKALGEQNVRGEIRPGFVADLVLTKRNPLEDIVNLTRNEGVMLRGKWFDGGELRSFLAK